MYRLRTEVWRQEVDRSLAERIAKETTISQNLAESFHAKDGVTWDKFEVDFG